MSQLEEYKPLEKLSGFYILTNDNQQKFLVWDNGKNKFPVGPMGYLPKSGLCFYDVLKGRTRNKKVLDLGCGEMGIISLFSVLDGAQEVTAVDIDEKCVSWLSRIKENYCFNQLTVFNSDMFQNIHETYDIIISNPPIMPMEQTSEKNIHDSGGSDGRVYLCKIINDAYHFLQNGGDLYLSAFSFLGTDKRTGTQESLKEYALNLGYRSFEIIKNVIKPLSEHSVTYQQLPYIKKIYPNMEDIRINAAPAVEFQILHIRK